MKMVHLISWREYQDILLRMKNGEQSPDLPVPEVPVHKLQIDTVQAHTYASSVLKFRSV
jgi:hypothetical protein